VFVRIWQFRARPDKAAEFRAVYGPLGEWAALFRGRPGYVGTELLESTSEPTAYVTLDRWESAEAWEGFLRIWAKEYAALDRRCEALVLDEEEVGAFYAPAASTTS
jgi:heme-degrading monooxygenase HmoA